MLDSTRRDQSVANAGAGAARVGIGGPVGSGKTALIEALIPVLQRRGIDFAVVTNDLVTTEDAERLRRSGLIDPARVSAVEAGAGPPPPVPPGARPKKPAGGARGGLAGPSR